MGVSKESISKFLIGNRFHVKLRILSPYSNRIKSTTKNIYNSEPDMTYVPDQWFSCICMSSATLQTTQANKDVCQ